MIGLVVELMSGLCAWAIDWNSLPEVGFEGIANGSGKDDGDGGGNDDGPGGGKDGGPGGGLGVRNRTLFERARFAFADSRALESRVLDCLQLRRWLLNAFV